MLSSRINARLSGPLAAFVERMVGSNGLYETPSEYVRDLIRRDIEARGDRLEQEAILAGYHDLEKGAIIPSTNDFHKDMAALAEKEEKSWQ